MHLLPSEVGEIGAADFDLLQRYWLEEPWGAHRDNIHAALIAREVRRTAFKGEHQWQDFMLRLPEDKDRRSASGQDREGVFGLFRAMAGGTKKAVPRRKSVTLEGADEGK